MNYKKNIGWLGLMILVLISLSGLAEIVPLFFLTAPTGIGTTVEPLPGVQPYSALRLEGRDIYIREGCMYCHSQMIRPLHTETERYGHYSTAGETVYDHPSLWGSKRTGPDLARIGQRYSNTWHRESLRDPRAGVPLSIMPLYPWLKNNLLDEVGTASKMRVMNIIIANTCPTCTLYSATAIADSAAKVRGKTEEDALIAYLNGDTEQPGGLGHLPPASK